MKKSILYDALSIAVNKIDTHPEYDAFLHFTFIVQDNKIVEWGRNNKGMPPKHYGYHERLVNAVYGPKIHSEISCWRKAKGLLDKNKGFGLINIRLSKKGKIRMSKPCHCCYNIMREFGCKEVYYTTNLGFVRMV